MKCMKITSALKLNQICKQIDIVSNIMTPTEYLNISRLRENTNEIEWKE